MISLLACFMQTLIPPAGTVVIEAKMLHSGGSAAHVEDLVVDQTFRRRGLGSHIVRALVEHARCLGCYKVIVDCAEHNTAFYERCGFKRKDASMVQYFPQDDDATVEPSLDDVILSHPVTTVIGTLTMRLLEARDFHRLDAFSQHSQAS